MADSKEIVDHRRIYRYTNFGKTITNSDANVIAFHLIG